MARITTGLREGARSLGKFLFQRFGRVSRVRRGRRCRGQWKHVAAVDKSIPLHLCGVRNLRSNGSQYGEALPALTTANLRNSTLHVGCEPCGL